MLQVCNGYAVDVFSCFMSNQSLSFAVQIVFSFFEPGTPNNQKQMVVPIWQLKSFTWKWLFRETSFSFWLFGVPGIGRMRRGFLSEAVLEAVLLGAGASGRSEFHGGRLRRTKSFVFVLLNTGHFAIRTPNSRWYLICELEDDDFPAHPAELVTIRSLKKAFSKDRRPATRTRPTPSHRA